MCICRCSINPGGVNVIGNNTSTVYASPREEAWRTGVTTRHDGHTVTGSAFCLGDALTVSRLDDTGGHCGGAI